MSTNKRPSDSAPSMRTGVKVAGNLICRHGVTCGADSPWIKRFDNARGWAE